MENRYKLTVMGTLFDGFLWGMLRNQNWDKETTVPAMQRVIRMLLDEYKDGLRKKNDASE